jgi:hypothetical protein
VYTETLQTNAHVDSNAPSELRQAPLSALFTDEMPLLLLCFRVLILERSRSTLSSETVLQSQTLTVGTNSISVLLRCEPP